MDFSGGMWPAPRPNKPNHLVAITTRHGSGGPRTNSANPFHASVTWQEGAWGDIFNPNALLESNLKRLLSDVIVMCILLLVCAILNCQSSTEMCNFSVIRGLVLLTSTLACTWCLDVPGLFKFRLARSVSRVHAEVVVQPAQGLGMLECIRSI